MKLILLPLLLSFSLIGQERMRIGNINAVVPASVIAVRETSELVTNVTETVSDSRPYCGACSGLVYATYPATRPPHTCKRGDVRTITTVVVRREKLVFEWKGAREIVRDTEVSRAVEVLALKSEWTRASLQTNVPPPSVFLVSTNMMIGTNETIITIRNAQ